MSGTRPFCVGLTGSIGMGKSTTTRLFAEEGAAVWDADDAVHRQYAPGGEGARVLADIAPDAINGGAVDRGRLSELIAIDPALLKRIEAVIHPLVARDREAYIQACSAAVAVFDIPLLFEAGLRHEFDAIVVVTAPEEVQLRRVLERPGMTRARFRAMLENQWPDARKRALADYVVDTSRGISDARAQVRRIFQEIMALRHA